MPRFRSRFLIALASLLIGAGLGVPAIGAGPTGSNWFQLFTLTQTGADNSGDGGTGNPSDYNYYYVGQSFTARTDIGISGANPSNGADLILNYNKDVVSASGLTPLSAYQYWTGQTIDNGIGQLTLSGYNDPGTYYSGQRPFVNTTFTMLRPTAANYGLAPTVLSIDYTFGVTTDSNIARDGFDFMDGKKDFNLLVWADIKAPYAQRPNPSNAATGAAVETPYSFEVRDSKNGAGDDSGVGTGFSTATAGRSVSVSSGGASSEYVSYANYIYSGVWQSVCTTTVSPPSPLGIPGDARRWEYNKTYHVTVSGWKDRASASQDQLGDANGPNTMPPASWTFSTESDTTPPSVSLRYPPAGASGVSSNTELRIDIVDKKSGNISGVGVNPSTCRINVSSPSVPLTTYSSATSSVTVTSVDYGNRFTIHPAASFAENEVVSVSVYGCQDLVGNTMVTDNYTFWTSDTTGPYVSDMTPANHATASAGTPITFHVKDTGGGVDLANVVVYVDGIYYSNTGGSGTVTTIGTRITYASSANFHGGNYAGDPTTVTGSSSDYFFTIKPQADFTAGQPVPVIVYARDLSGNLMERYVTSFGIAGGTCDGSAFCGTNTSWSGAMCVGTGGGTTGGTCAAPQPGGSTVQSFTIGEPITVTQIDDTSVLVSWLTSQASTGRVLYDTIPHPSREAAPLYGYAQSTPASREVTTYHSAVVDGLTTGHLYYFVPVAGYNGAEYLGHETLMAPRYPTVVERTVIQTAPGNACPAVPVPPPAPAQPVIPATPAAPVSPITPQPGLSFTQLPMVTPVLSALPAVTLPVQPTTTVFAPAETIVVPPVVLQKLKILKIDTGTTRLRFNGYATPNSIVNIFVYSQPLVFQTQTDANGQWSVDLPNNLELGMHTLVVEDAATGQRDSTFFYVEKPQVTVIQSVVTVMPPMFLYVFLILLVIILILVVDLIRIAYKMRHLKAGRIDYRPHVLFLCFAALMAVFITGTVFEQRTKYFSQLSQTRMTTAPKVSVKGSVIDPASHQPVPGVDLTVGNATIHTGTDGLYDFTDIDTSVGMKINHPQLTRSLRWIFPAAPKEQTVEVPFDPKMYDALVNLVNAEAAGKWDTVLASMPADARAQTGADALRKQGTIFATNNLSDQELVIEKAEISSTLILQKTTTANLVRIRVRANGATADYAMTFEQNKWFAIQQAWK